MPLRDAPCLVPGAPEVFLSNEAASSEQMRDLLEAERRTRREAEEALARERDYIKHIQDTLQRTRVIIDPVIYRDVANTYIAKRQKPARRTHSLAVMSGRDLVCDQESSVAVVSPWVGYSEHLRTSSCPSSPGQRKSTDKLMKTSSPHYDSRAPPPMKPWEYEELLSNLERLTLEK